MKFLLFSQNWWGLFQGNIILEYKGLLLFSSVEEWGKNFKKILFRKWTPRGNPFCINIFKKCDGNLRNLNVKKPLPNNKIIYKLIYYKKTFLITNRVTYVRKDGSILQFQSDTVLKQFDLSRVSSCSRYNRIIIIGTNYWI